MDFDAFKQEVSSRPYISGRDLASWDRRDPAFKNQLSRWKKRGLLLSLRKGFYILKEAERKIVVDPRLIANVIYEPSYISLESALQSYGLIPERVADITSVTTRKTAHFDNSLGRFVYQHIKPEAFRGFRMIAGVGGHVFMADPEKAVADFIYLNLALFVGDARKVLQDSFRFQNVDVLNPEILAETGNSFRCPKLTRVLGRLAAWVKEERG